MIHIETNKPFSESLIWDLQRKYFENAGIEAWQKGEVPHYITSNPVVGKTYAELVLALLKDLSYKGQHKETVYLLELGAGHGRLCYHFFKYFEKYFEKSAIKLPPICYVLSDFTDANVKFMENHSRLQPYVQKGWLDFALFDAEKDIEIYLRNKKKTIQTGNLLQPLIVIGNYFFDTIPQELFKIEHLKIENVLLSISTETDTANLNPAERIKDLEMKYDYKESQYPLYPDEPFLDKIIESYRKSLEDTHLLFPETGLRCLERLRKLSKAGIMVLTADKGNHHLSNMDFVSPPGLSTHGSFSFSVNYHAFKEYTIQQGGIACFPLHQHSSLDLGCLLLVNNASSYIETLQAYEKFVQEYGPDDYFNLKKLIEKNYNSLTYHDTIATIRLSGYDARIFMQMKARLFELVPTLSNNQRFNMLSIVIKIWEHYYPLKEVDDVATTLGDLLLGMAFYKEAILYYEKSIIIYGRTPDLLYKIALCYCLEGLHHQAIPIINDLIDYDPENESLKSLIKEFELEKNL